MSASVNLDQLLAEDGGTITLNHVEHRVLPISGIAIHRLTTAAPEDRIAVVYDIAAEVCPTLTREQIDTLSPRAINAIVEVSQSTATAVTAAAPNAAGPDETTISPA